MQAASEILDLAFNRHADELRSSWQGRLLSGALSIENGVARPIDLMGAVVLSILAHNFDEAVPVMLRVCHPGYQGLGVPMLCSAAKIARTGAVMADIIGKSGNKASNQQIFRDERHMRSALRRLADRSRLGDADREEFFAAARRWVVCDYRLDPTMNPADPDAKRLTVH